MRGRKPKPISEHKLHGTLNITRHRERMNAPEANGEPVKPSHLKGDAGKMWDFIVEKLVKNGTAKALDTMALVVVCEMWALYRKAMRKSERHPTDRDVRIAVLQYKTAWETSAAKCGLNPTDRQRIRADVSEGRPPVKTRKRA